MLGLVKNITILDNQRCSGILTPFFIYYDLLDCNDWNNLATTRKVLSTKREEILWLIIQRELY